MASIQLNPSADTFLDSTNPTHNNGGSFDLILARSGGSQTKKTIIYFNLSVLPAGAVVSAATLRIHAASISANTTIAVHRAFQQWFESISDGATPGAGVDASTWNLRNHNGSVAWSGGAGGALGLAYATSPTTTLAVTTAAGQKNLDVLSDIAYMLANPSLNYGWWLMLTGTDSSISLYSRESFEEFRPRLLLTYNIPSPVVGTAAGTSTATAKISARIGIQGLAEGSSTFYAKLTQPGAIIGSSVGTSTAEGTLRARGYLGPGESHGIASAESSGTLMAIGNLANGTAAGVATVTGHLMSRMSISGSSTGQAITSGSITMVGLMRGTSAGVATAIATGWMNATGKARSQICETTPLLYITDGSYLPNGQLDMLDLLSVRGGFLLKEWVPSVAQYKGGGYFSDSVTANGRRLARRVFENPIEVMTLSLKSDNQDRTIWFIREYFRWQELAADYWTSDWATRPVYLVARSAREMLTRYAIIHVMSMPALTNPYSQPFFTNNRQPAMEDLALRIEREPWTDVPPGAFEPVPLSSIRSWTVASWEGS